MKPILNRMAQLHLTATFLRLGLGLLAWHAIRPVLAQDAPPAVQPPARAASTNAPLAGTGAAAATDEMQLSFQGANIDLIVQWLAKTTGKSVVKHPRVQCQLTIVGSRKLSQQEAVSLVYRALALEGFAVVESSNSILILPEGTETKVNADLAISRAETPSGRERLVKIFTLKNISPAELKEKVRVVLSEKATIDVADRANQIMVSDFADNIGLLGELIKELDVPAGGDTTIEFFSLKYAEAEELGNLLSLILNAQAAPPSAPGRASSSSVRSSSSSFPGGVAQFPSGSPQPSSPSPSTGGAPPPAGGDAQVKIWPDKVSNRLIVAAQKSKFPEVRRLIDLLDTETPKDVSIRVLPLKNVSAEDLVRDLGPLYLKMSGKSAKDVIEVTASSRANSLIILSSEANFRIIDKLVATLDTEEAQEKVLRAFPLKNADAEEVAKQLLEINQDQDGQSRFPYYIFSSSMMGGRSAKKPTFVADRRRNTVIVQAAPSALGNIEKLIEALDAPVNDDSLAPRIFRLKYVSATDIEEVLNELFLKKQTQRNYYDPFGNPARDTDSQSGAGKLYGKVRITSESYANALIVTSSSLENLAAVEDVIKQLDTPSQAGETTFRVSLRFAKASTVANSINILFARGGAPPMRQVNQPGQSGGGSAQQQQQQQQGNYSQASFGLEQETKEEGYFPWLGGQPETGRSADGRNLVRPVSDLVGRVRVVPDQRSNALLISANLHLFAQVVKLIEELDAPTAQVLIEARIVEVSSDFMDKLGVRWSPDGSQTFTADDLDNSILGTGSANYLKGFGGLTSVNTPSASGVPQALANLRSGVLHGSVNMDFLIQFLRKTTDATVLASPQINIADNELGKLFVGQQVPFIDKSQSTDVGSLNQSFQYKDVGIILEVTPHINDTGDVALKIRAESSSIVPGQTLFGGAILDTRNFKTDVTAKDGETLVLGGIIQRQVSETLRKTPVLGDIPGLGWAFKKKDKQTRQVELMVFLRPKVVRTPAEARELLEEMDRKAPLIKKWREESLPAKDETKAKDTSGK